MATQIASTPVIKGKEATVIYKEMQNRPQQASKRGAKILSAKYGCKTVK